MKAKTRIRIIFTTLISLALGFPLLFLTATDKTTHYEPEDIAVSFMEHLACARFAEARQLATPESEETLHMLETLVGNQATELQHTPMRFTVADAEMNSSQDTLLIEGKLFFAHQHKLLRKSSLVLVNREGRWLVDYRDNSIF